jgi:plastocyanin
MSLVHDSLRAFVAGIAVCGLAYAASAAVPATSRVSIDNFTFKPDVLTVRAGTTVVFENDDDIPHTVVATDGTFRSGALDSEDKFTFTFDQSGTYDYFCSLHPHMMGKVIVTQ